MSAIQTFQVSPRTSGSALKGVWTEAKANSTSADRPRGSDEAMMYAWSIGVTKVARDMGAARREEPKCPPEVYIG